MDTIVQGVAGVVDDIDREDLEDGGIIRDAIDGELSDEFEDFGDSFNEVIEDADPEDVPLAVLAFLQDQEVDIEELLSSAPGLGTVGSFGFGIALAVAFSDFEEIEDFEDFVSTARSLGLEVEPSYQPYLDRFPLPAEV